MAYILSTPTYTEPLRKTSEHAHHVHPPDENDPLFENLVRCVTRHCLTFMDENGGDFRDYFIGTSAQAKDRLQEYHRLPPGTSTFLRDGLNFPAARTIVQQMVLKGCHGVPYIAAEEGLELYMYRIIPGVTVEDE
jgi:hypothetical protein